MTRRSTHIRLGIELTDRLRAISQQTKVPLTKLLDHIVREALPVFEERCRRSEPLGVVPGWDDDRGAKEIARAAAQDAERAAASARKAAAVASAFAEVDSNATKVAKAKKKGFAMTTTRDGAPRKDAPREAVPAYLKNYSGGGFMQSDTRKVVRTEDDAGRCLHKRYRILSHGGRICKDCDATLKPLTP